MTDNEAGDKRENVDISILAQLRERAAGNPRRIVFPESDDPRVQAAAASLIRQGICTPVFLGGDGSVGAEVFTRHPSHDQWLDKAIATYAKKRSFGSVDSRNALQNSLLLAAVLVDIGYVDGGVAGSVATTSNVLRAGLRGIGLGQGCDLLSSTFLLEHLGRALIFGDCAVNPNPDAAQLAQIAVDSATTYQQLTGDTPHVALLSFSTLGSAQHDMLEKIKEALTRVQDRRCGLAIDGELQFDAAFVPSVGAKKAPHSSVAGRANVFIFPDLNAANIGYKIAERMGGAAAVGPILQGLAKPWLDLSRGCSVEDIVDAAVITSLQVATDADG